MEDSYTRQFRRPLERCHVFAASPTHRRSIGFRDVTSQGHSSSIDVRGIPVNLPSLDKDF